MKTDEFTSELDRLDALLKWWGAPTADRRNIPQAHLARFDAIVSELERAVAEISRNQERALNQSKDLLVKSIPLFVNGRDLNEVMSAQSKILLSLFDSASTQVKSWVYFAEKIRNAQLALAAAGMETDAEIVASAKTASPEPARTGSANSASGKEKPAPHRRKAANAD